MVVWWVVGIGGGGGCTRVQRDGGVVFFVY